MSGFEGALRPNLRISSGSLAHGSRSERYGCSRVKRAFDLLVCVPMLVCSAPLMALIALVLRFSGPVFFKQERVGLDGRKFVIFKFRTMVVDAEKRLLKLLSEDPAARREWEATHKLTKDPRITVLGRLLRLSSLDELPQLLNVLRGDMSIVGPRPIIEMETMMYNRYILHYMSVKPGLTGLWQVSGRSGTSYRRRVAFDVFYSRHASLWLDFLVLLKTLPAVLRADGAR